MAGLLQFKMVKVLHLRSLIESEEDTALQERLAEALAICERR